MILRWTALILLGYLLWRWIRRRTSLPARSWNAYDELGVRTTDSTEAIRTAYRQALSQYHPDKVQQLGSELQELAERKTQRIVQAYRLILQERGEAR